jgi:hypothetical protein
VIRSEDRIDGGKHASHLYCGCCAHHLACRERSELRLPCGLSPLWRRPLLPAMSSQDAGRAETPSAGFFQNARKRFWLASIGLTALVIVPGATYFAYRIIRPPSDEVLKAIVDAGFDPLVPPTRLRGPGALYEVEGRSYRVVCPVDPSLLNGKLQKSPTEDRVRSRLESGGFSLAADYLAKINGKLGGDRLTSIQFSLTNVEISEVAEQYLSEIQDVLLSQPSCSNIVTKLLRAKKKVCSGYAALSATTSYKVNVASKFAATEESKRPVLEKVKSAIEEHAGSEIKINRDDELKGEDLFYGIQLSRLCMTLDDGSGPSVLTQTP